MSPLGQPATAADITPEWIIDVALALRLEGQAYRAGACGLAIEVQSIRTGAWHALALPTLAGRFADQATCRHTLACIEDEVRTRRTELFTGIVRAIAAQPREA